MSFVNYEGAHPDLSSEVTILPEVGILRKIRPDRSEENLLSEYARIIGWSTMLQHYDPGVDLGTLQSPYPLGFDIDARSITMTFCRGFILPQAFSGDHELRDHRLPKQAVRAQIAFGLGRLAAIKKRESLLHGDFRTRHVLFDPLTSADFQGQPRMSVIDVESTALATPDEVAAEDAKLKTWLDQVSPKRTADYIIGAYQEGLHSLEPGEDPVWNDAMYVAADELGIDWTAQQPPSN